MTEKRMLFGLIWLMIQIIAIIKFRLPQKRTNFWLAEQLLSPKKWLAHWSIVQRMKLNGFTRKPQFYFCPRVRNEIPEQKDLNFFDFGIQNVENK